jgi:hypothetical protein
VRYLPFEAIFNPEAKTWGVIGRDRQGNDFGTAVGETRDIATTRLREWVLYSLGAQADKGIDAELLLEKQDSQHALVFIGSDFDPSRRRLRLARGPEPRHSNRRVQVERRSDGGRRDGDSMSLQPPSLPDAPA